MIKYNYGVVLDIQEDNTIPSQITYVGDDLPKVIDHICEAHNVRYEESPYTLKFMILIVTGQQVPIIGTFYHNTTNTKVGVLVESVQYDYQAI